MALGFLATKARSDVLTLSIPADLVPELVGAREHVVSPEAVRIAGEQLTGPRDLLDELLRATVDECAEQVAVAGGGLLRSEGSTDELRAAVRRLSDLLDLLDAARGAGEGS